MKTAITMILFAAAALQPSVRDGRQDEVELSVSVEYTGKGQVDAKHPLVVFLFSQADPNAAPPLASDVLTSKSGTVKFKVAESATVYVAALYDESGQFKVNDGPPPIGTPVTAHRKAGSRELAPVPVATIRTLKLVIDGSERWGQ